MIDKNTRTLKVLDHGSMTLRNMSGPTRRIFNDPTNADSGFRAFDADDTDVANAARLSFDQADGTRLYSDEMKLAKYLAENHHDTPFEAIVVWFEMELPIFVARQLHRQRTQTINEESGRYIKLCENWYIPDVVSRAPDKKKQGAAGPHDPLVQKAFKADLDEQCRESYRLYSQALSDGIAPEQARLFLHVNHYTHYMSTMNLRNLFFSFLRLRRHSHAQFETQQYAKALFSLMDPHLPGLMKIFDEFIAMPEKVAA